MDRAVCGGTDRPPDKMSVVVAPTGSFAVVIDPNPFSKIGTISRERYSAASERFTESRNAGSPRRIIRPYGS